MKRIILLSLFLALSLNAQITGLAGWDLFVDPGHSRTENMGVCGYSEAEQNLGTALHVIDLFMSNTDIDTVISSRYNDNVQVSLAERCNHANTQNSAWFHSIHSNAGGASSNNVLLLWGQWYNGTPDPPVGGEAVSDIMIQLMPAAMRIPSIGSWGDCSFYTWNTYCQNNPTVPYLYVNRNTSMPSELSEQGFHTNPEHNQMQMNDMWKRMVAYSIYWTFLEHFDIDRPYPGILAGVISDAESGEKINGATVHVAGESYTTDTYESMFHQYPGYDPAPEDMHNGFYFFEGLADTIHEVVFTAPDYNPDTFYTSMDDDFITFLDVELTSALPPMVTYSEPAQGDTMFPAWNVLRFDFSRPMNTESMDTSFSMEPAVEGGLVWGNNHTLMAFIPGDSLEFETEYTVTIAASALDVYDHPFDGNGDGIGGDDYVLHFRTGPPDLTPPEIETTYPVSNSTIQTTTPVIAVTYNEELDDSSLDPDLFILERIYGLQEVDYLLEHYVVDGMSHLQFYPLEELDPDEDYRLKIWAGVQDLNGNTATQNYALTFTTPEYLYNQNIIDAFEGNAIANWWEPAMSGSTAGTITDETGIVSSAGIMNHAIGSTASLQLNYGWNPEAASWLIRMYMPPGTPGRNVHFTEARIMQAWIFGDGQGNRARFCLDDAAGDHEVSPWYTIDWVGWRLISWDMSVDGTGTWIGNGNLDGTLEFDSFQFTYTEDAPNIGTYYIDDLRVVTRDFVGVEAGENTLPKSFALLPNYPNPFNPLTTIPFALTESGKVEITLYNLQGERIQTIFSGSLAAGYHQTRFDGSAFASGTYLLHLQSGSQSTSRKITLLK